MNFITSFILFVILFFIYVHVLHQYKKSQDLEIYELDYKNNENLQEICDIRQPVVFFFEHDKDIINLDTITSLEQTQDVFLHVKDTNDYYCTVGTQPPTEVALTFQSTMQLIKTDTNAHFFTENNHIFLEETGIDEIMTNIGNQYLKPNYTVWKKFDVMTGTKNVELPLRMHTNTRKYIHVSNGKITVKMTPFKNNKKLEMHKNVSKINVWVPQPEYVSTIQKIRFLEFDVVKGNVLYIPPYWIYSIKYCNDNTCLLEYNYCTIMNIISHPQTVFPSILSSIASMFEKHPPENSKKKEYVEQNKENALENNENEKNKDNIVVYDNINNIVDMSVITN